MSTVNTFGLRFAYNFKTVFKNTKINPFAIAGLTYLEFDSKALMTLLTKYMRLIY